MGLRTLSPVVLAAALAATVPAPLSTAAGQPAIRPGPGQVTILDAPPGADVALRADGRVVAEGEVDLLGSLLFRELSPGEYSVEVSSAAGDTAAAVTVPGFDEHPPPQLYSDQEVGEGFGYIEVRDGTTLSVFVALPGAPEDGPYPTVVEYAGYDTSNPALSSSGVAPLAVALGYAWVGVNMRGSGCSGGSFDYFEPIQATDGYDVIETVAAQPWVQDHRVGMVGISYSGISQLYVAATQPPSLVAVAPLSVVDNSALYTLHPGGILNDGFALSWAKQRDIDNAAFGQGWTRARVENGDVTCRANQRVRLQNPGLERQVRDNPFYVPGGPADKTDVRPLLGDISVPVYLAGAWQDEQTGGHFANMLDLFTGTDRFYATLTNGLHTDSLAPVSAARWVEFLDLYVRGEVPSLEALRAIGSVLGQQIWETDDLALPDDRFAGMTYEQALAAFEADRPIEILLEQGAGGTVSLAPVPAWTHSFDSWPVADAEPAAWYLGPAGTMHGEPPGLDGGSTTYVANPNNVPSEGYFDEDAGGNIWSVDAEFDWAPEAEGTAARWVSEPFDEDTVVVGSGSADLWIAADAPDTDLEVTLSELRPDGTEVLVQSGWLRASGRALDREASTELHPVHTFLEADVAPLPAGELVPVRVDIYPFAHPFRAGSRLRVTVDAPGGNRQIWLFDTIGDGETVTIAHDADHPSRIVLPTLTGIDIPDDYPACGALRGQPCRQAAP